MKKKALKKEFRVEVRKSLNRFLSIFFIVAMGVAFFTGIHTAAPDMRATGDYYYDQNTLMDLRVISTLGLTRDDLNALQEIEGIEKVEGCYMEDVYCGETSERKVLHIESMPKQMNELVPAEGSLPQKPGECFLDSEYARANGIAPGDVLEITVESEEDSMLRSRSYLVSGYGYSPVYISFERGTTVLGTGELSGFVYVVPEEFDAEVYSVAYMTVSGAKEAMSYTDTYNDLVETVYERVEDISDVRCEIRYQEVMDEAQEALDEGKQEVADGKQELEDAKQELADAESEAYQEISEAESELIEGESELADARQELEDAKQEIAEGESELADGEKEIADNEEKLADAKVQIADGIAELNSGEAQYQSGLAEYNEKAATATKQLDAAQKQIDDGKIQLEQGWSEYYSNLAVLEDGEEQLALAELQLADSQAQFDAAYDDTIAQLEAGQVQYAQGIAQLDAGKQDYQAGELQLKESQAAYDAGREQLDAAWAQYDAGMEQLSSGSGQDQEETAAVLAATKQTLDQKETELAAAKAQLDAGWAELAANKGQLDAAEQQLSAAKAEIDAGYAALESADAQLKAGWAQIEQQKIELANGKAALAEGKIQLEETIETLESSQEEIDKGRKELSDAKNELTSARQQLDSGWAQLNASQEELTDGERQLEDAKTEIADARIELADAHQEIADAEEEIAENEQKIADGWIELEEGRLEAEQEIADAKQKIADAEQELLDAEEKIADAEAEIADIKKPKWYIDDRTALPENAGFGENADRMSSLARVFPVMFFLVAALISLTTMTRMVEEERTQIGTMKALGYSRLDIAGKYLKYALYATIGGSIVGALFGEKIFPWVIITAYGIMYTYVPKILLPYNLQFALIATGAALFCTIGATLSACFRVMQEVPAQLMRPPAPKDGKRVLLEYIPFIWRPLKFTWKSTIRNLMRYKKRFLMTVIGIGGCMGLLLVGYGLRDSIMGIGTLQFHEVQTYQGMAIIDTDASADKQNEVSEKAAQLPDISAYAKYYMQLEEVQTGAKTGKEWSAYIYVPEQMDNLYEFLCFRKRGTQERYELTDDGAIITEKIARELGIKVGDTVMLELEAGEEIQIPIAAICENYLAHYIYLTPTLYEQVFGEVPEYNCMLYKTDAEEERVKEIGKELLECDAVLNITYTSELEAQIKSMLSALDSVMIVLILAAGLLAFVVLYNLNNININERRRELATLKVLGFFNGEVAAYVYRENIILTLLGAGAGCGIGRLLHLFIITTVEVDSTMFGRNINWQSYLIGTLFTILFSCIVNFVMYFKLKKIDMVESLKSIE